MASHANSHNRQSVDKRRSIDSNKRKSQEIVDLPAPFLPQVNHGIVNNTNRNSLRDPRKAAMEAAVREAERLKAFKERQLHERPVSLRSGGGASLDSSRPISNRIENASIGGHEDKRRPVSISSSSTQHRPPGMNEVETEAAAGRPISLASSGGGINNKRTSKRVDDARVDPADVRVTSLRAGDRGTLRFSANELKNKLAEQIANLVATKDGDLVDQVTVDQELHATLEANRLLDEEIARLEAKMTGGNGTEADFDEMMDWENDWESTEKKKKLDYMRPSTYKPRFSLLIFIVTTAVMAAEIGVNKGIEDYKVNPVFGPKPDVLLLMGAKRTDLIQHGDYWRLVTPIFLHGGILHLLFNMLGLWNIGVSLEREFGPFKIAAIYFLSGVFGVVLSCLFVPNTLGVGASGAIFGLFGSCWADLLQNFALYRGAAKTMLFQLVLMTSLNLIIGVVPFLDNFAHLGGLISGFILGLIFLVQGRYYYNGVKKKKKPYQWCLISTGIVLYPIVFGTLLILLFTGVNLRYQCPLCLNFDCVVLPLGAEPKDRWWNCDACSNGGINYNQPNSTTLELKCPEFPYNVVSAARNGSNPVGAEEIYATCLNLCVTGNQG